MQQLRSDRTACEQPMVTRVPCIRGTIVLSYYALNFAKTWLFKLQNHYSRRVVSANRGYWYSKNYTNPVKYFQDTSRACVARDTELFFAKPPERRSAAALQRFLSIQEHKLAFPFLPSFSDTLCDSTCCGTLARSTSVDFRAAQPSSEQPPN